MRTETQTVPNRAEVRDVIRMATGDRDKSWSNATKDSPYVRWSVLYVTSAHFLCRGNRADRYHTSLVIHPKAVARLSVIDEVRDWMADHPLAPTIAVPGEHGIIRVPLTIAAFPIVLDEFMIDGACDDVSNTCLVARQKSKLGELKVILKLTKIFG